MSIDDTDEDLMVRYQRGEVRAFEVLLTRHRRAIYNFILRFVGDRETAEDLLQEAFLRVIKGAEAYKRQAKFTTWLYTIARNRCLSELHAGRDAVDVDAVAVDLPFLEGVADQIQRGWVSASPRAGLPARARRYPVRGQARRW